MRLTVTLRSTLCGVGLVLGIIGSAAATDYVVSPTGNDSNPGTVASPFRTVQKGLNSARVPGDSVLVQNGVFHERLVFPSSGSVAGLIQLKAFGTDVPVIDGTGVPGNHLVYIRNKSFLRIEGFEFRNNVNVVDGSGVRLEGAGTQIEIINNDFHDLTGVSAMAITVYGTAAQPWSKILIDSNEVFDCEPAPSEAITLNGNVTDFIVSRNGITNVNNIGIDCIGGEKSIQPNSSLVARNGLVKGNIVRRCRSNYEDGFAAGIYVDGGKSIVIDGNIISQCDVGLEIGAENKGLVTSAIVVQNNLIFRNDKAGIAFGGYASNRGRTQSCRFIHNTVFQNDTLDAGFGQLWIQFASGNTVANNIFVAGANKVLIASDAGNTKNVLDNNVWFSASGASNVDITWNGRSYSTFAAYKSGAKQDAKSLFADPQLVNPAGAENFHLLPGSPAINAADRTAARTTPFDVFGTARPQGLKPDIGAVEFVVP